MMAPSVGLLIVTLSALIIGLQGTGAADSSLDKQILGGRNAKKGQFPWQVLVYSDNDNAAFMCGGSVIDVYWVLTAGHCIRGGNVILKFGGLLSNLSDKSEPGSVTVLSKTHFVHEDFEKFDEPNENGVLAENDIAVIRLRKPLKLSNTIQPVKLPRLSQRSKTFVGEAMIASGWGYTNYSDPPDPRLEGSATLKYVDLEVGSYSNCMANHFICNKGSTTKSALQGDSGGPLVWKDRDGKFVQIGIVSQLGGGYEDDLETGPFLFADAFTFVPYYLDWIADKTGIKIAD